MKLTYSKSQFEIPEGQYVTQFQGIEMIDPKPGEAPRVGQDGRVMPPPMAWQFLILEGPEKGKSAARVTGRMPTPRSACGRMLVAVSGQILKDGMEVDLDQYKGKYFRVNVVEKETGQGTCVSDQGILPIPAPTGQATNGQAPASASGPPPRRNATASTPAAAMYYIEASPDTDPLVMDEAAARKWFIETAANPGSIQVCKVGDQQWKAACEVFSGLIPF